MNIAMLHKLHSLYIIASLTENRSIPCFLDALKIDIVKPALRGHSKRPKMFFKTDYCLMQVKSIAECSNRAIKVLQIVPREDSVILSTFSKLPFVFKAFVLSILSDRLNRFYCMRILKCIWISIARLYRRENLPTLRIPGGLTVFAFLL